MRQAKLKNPARYWLGRKRPELKGIFINTNPPWNKGKKNVYSEECLNRMSLSRQGKCIREKNPSWLGGISKEPYSFGFDNSLKCRIRKRDGYVCQVCKLTRNQLCFLFGRNYRILSIHHIDYDKKNDSPLNLVSLCWSCHCATNHNKAYWEVQFTITVSKMEVIKNRNWLVKV